MSTHNKLAGTANFLPRFLLVSALSGISVGMAGIIVTLYASGIGATSAQLGLLRGLESIGGLLTILPMGYLVDHLGAKKIFTAGSAAGVIIYGLLPNAATITWLTAAVSVLGLFMSFRFVCMNSVLFNALEVIGMDKSGWHRAASFFGMSFLGPMIGGYMVGEYGYRIAFYGVSVTLATSAVLAFFLFGSHERLTRDQAAELPPVRQLLRNRKFLNACFGECVGSAALATFNTFAVVLALQVLHFSRFSAVLVISLDGFVFIVALMLAGRYLPVYGEANGHRLSILLAIVSLLLIGAVAHPAALWLGAAVLAAGIGIQTVINLSIVSSEESAKGKVAGVFGLFPVAGMAAGPLIGGFIANSLGLRAAFLAIIPLFILLGINYSGIVNRIISGDRR